MRKNILNLGMTALFMSACFILAAPPLHAARWMMVKDDVVDVRSDPGSRAISHDHDPKQETQVLKGEIVRVLKIRNGWANVRCVQQMEYTHHRRWEGYPGWVPLTALQPMSGRHKPRLTPPLSEQNDALRQRIVDEARKLIGAPYFWGGRSFYVAQDTGTVTGVDCSGLISLAYWNVGWTIPRDAHEQFLKATRVEAHRLHPGDLIFLSTPGQSNRITHVLMMATPTTVIEAPQTGEKVREVPFDQRLGVSRSLAKNGDKTPDGRTIFFGSYFPTEVK
jgi:hypothetical protein